MRKKPRERFRILAVDDNRNTLEVIDRHLTKSGYRVSCVMSVEEALEFLEKNAVDLIISDLKMPKTSGLDLVKHVRENLKDVEIMMVTAYPTIEGAVEAVKEGAEEYLAKPFTDEELLTAVDRILEKLVRHRNIRIERIPTKKYGIIGESEIMQGVFRLIEKAASTLANVLISGESGTGKELVARAIHYNSDRSSAPFVSVNCTAIPDTLLESELFGHVKGAFTGARESRPGFFQIADGGTIFLDEIGDASFNMQGKLLRVMQNKEIYMVGSSRVRKVNTRIIAATHKDLLGLVQKGLFREDLYYRLAVVDIPVSPLHEREEDTLLLTKHFVEKYSKEMNRDVPAFTDNALKALKTYRWPGNVRELENLIQRLLVLMDGDTLDVSDLAPAMRFSVSPSSDVSRSLAEVEAEHIMRVLASVSGNKTRASKILGIDRKTLREKIKRFGLPS